MVSAIRDLSPAEHEKVQAAVLAAQARTHARFALVVVHASDRYHLYPVFWGAGLAFIALGAIALGYPHLNIRFAFAIVTAIFVAVSLVLEWRPLRFFIVPKATKQAHAHALAHREFVARVLSHQGVGVLFFVSLWERYAEVIADNALHQAAGQDAWNRIVADFTEAAREGRLADGFVAGVEACGALLETHHPKG